MTFIHNSSSNPGGGVGSMTVTSQNGGKKLGGLGYSNFYFKEIKK